MSKGKYQNGKSKMSMKPLALLLAAVLLVGVSIGGTLAWLQATTKEVENTFTDSDIGVTLEETTTEYKMIPGHYIEKNPKVTVTADSEACWLFVKITESTDPELSDYIHYEIAEGWTQGDGTDIPANVYYREVSDTNADQAFGVIGYTDNKGTETEDDDVFVADKVLVNDTVTKEMMNAIKNGSKPTLTFQAYAVQLMENNTTKFEAKEAWNQAKDLEPLTPSESEGATNE